MTGAYLTDWQLRTLVFSIILAAASYIAVSLWSGWQEVVNAFVKIGTTGTLLVLSMSLINYGLRFTRWQTYLTELRYPMPWLSSLRIYLSGFALTTTPAKAGEAFRGLLLRQRDVPFPASFAALISERLSDLTAIVLLALLGLYQYPQARGLVLAGVAGIVLVLVCISSQRVLAKLHVWATSRTGKLTGTLVHFVNVFRDTRRCHSPWLLLRATAISVLAWGAEALAFYWVLLWLGIDVSLSFAIFIYAIAMLTGALSFLPGGLGGAEAVMVSLLIFKGASMPEAIAATVFIRLATLWFAVLIGLIALHSSRHGEEVSA